MAILQQLRLSVGAGLRQFAFEQLGNGRAEDIILACVLIRERGDRLRDARGIESNVGLCRRLARHSVHPIRIMDSGCGVTKGMKGR